MKMLFRAAFGLSVAALCAPINAQNYGKPAAPLTGKEPLTIFQSGEPRITTTGQIAALSGGSGGGGSASTPLNVSGIGRDSAGRVNAFTSSGIPYTVTYDSFGPATIAGGGKTTTVTRSAQGAVTGISTQ